MGNQLIRLIPNLIPFDIAAKMPYTDDDFPLDAKPRRQKGNKAGPGNMATLTDGNFGQ